MVAGRCRYISIHLMLMLINLPCFIVYNFVSISIHLMLMLIYNRFQVPPLLTLYFNTSHVNVNQAFQVALSPNGVYFNTSHVNVNRLMYSFTTIGASISIHLMLMLIIIIALNMLKIAYFNTSHVNVNLYTAYTLSF